MYFICFLFVLRIPSSPHSFDAPNNFWLCQPQPRYCWGQSWRKVGLWVRCWIKTDTLALQGGGWARGCNLTSWKLNCLEIPAVGSHGSKSGRGGGEETEEFFLVAYRRRLMNMQLFEDSSLFPASTFDSSPFFWSFLNIRHQVTQP